MGVTRPSKGAKPWWWAFLGEDLGGFTPRDDEMKLFLGQAKDIVVKRTIDRRNKVRVQGNLYDYDVIVKYEIENFKDQQIVLDLAESITALRSETLRDTGRDVEWEFGTEGTLKETRNAEKSTAEKVVFNVPLPPRGADQKAVKQMHTLHVVIRNEWCKWSPVCNATRVACVRRLSGQSSVPQGRQSIARGVSPSVSSGQPARSPGRGGRTSTAPAGAWWFRSVPLVPGADAPGY